MTKLTGTDAIEYAEAHNLPLHKHADPTEGAREVSVEEAREIAAEDPSLIWIEIRDPHSPILDLGHVIVRQEGGRYTVEEDPSLRPGGDAGGSFRKVRSFSDSASAIAHARSIA